MKKGSKSPEAQFRVNFTQALTLLYRGGDSDEKNVLQKLSKTVVDGYNEYFESIGIGIKFKLENGQVAIDSKSLRYDKEKLDHLVELGLLKKPLKDSLKGVMQDIEEWQIALNKALEEDSKEISKKLQNNPGEMILQREIAELAKEYAKKRNEFLISIAQLILIVAIIATISVLTGLAIIPITAAVGTIGSTAIFALSEMKNITKGLNNSDEREKAWKDFEAKSDESKKDILIKYLDNTNIVEFLKEGTIFVAKNTELDKNFNATMQGIQNEKIIDDSPAKIKPAALKERVVSHNSMVVHQQTLGASRRFNNSIKEYLKQIYDKNKSIADKDVIRDSIYIDLKSMYINAHNQYFKDIGLPEFQLTGEGLDERLHLKFQGKGVLDFDVFCKGLSKDKGEALKKAFESFNEETKAIESMLNGDADKMADLIGKNASAQEVDEALDGVRSKMDGALRKCHASAFKLSVAVLLVIGVSVATFFGVIPIVGVVGIVCTATLFSAKEIEAIVESKASYTSIKAKYDKTLEDRSVEGLPKDFADALKSTHYVRSEVDQKFLDLIESLPGKERSASITA